METERGADDQDLKWFPKPKQKKMVVKLLLNSCQGLMGGWEPGGVRIHPGQGNVSRESTIHTPPPVPMSI